MSTTHEQLGELYPFESHWFEIDGLRMHYVDEGAGEPVVMVHGNPTWSFYFRELIKALRGERRVIAADHVGCGFSDKPPDARYEYVLERRVSDLEALLDHLGLQRGVTLVVHDWGGMIGLACALRKPERIARIVVLNTAAFLLPSGKRLPWRLALLRHLPLLPALLVRGFNVFANGATRMATVPLLSLEVRRAYTLPYDSWANRIATLRFVQDIPLKPTDASYALVKEVDERLSSLSDVPMLICWGLRDFVFDASFLKEWRRRFPRAEVHEFANAGHYVLEDARDAVIEATRDFMQRNPINAGDVVREAS